VTAFARKFSHWLSLQAGHLDFYSTPDCKQFAGFADSGALHLVAGEKFEAVPQSIAVAHQRT